MSVWIGEVEKVDGEMNYETTTKDRREEAAFAEEDDLITGDELGLQMTEEEREQVVKEEELGLQLIEEDDEDGN